jgi:hypothetical protein
MGKVIVVVLGLAAILAAAQYALKSAPAAPAADLESAPAGLQQPQRQLQNVRNAAHRIEADAQRRADEGLQRSTDALQTE